MSVSRVAVVVGSAVLGALGGSVVLGACAAVPSAHAAPAALPATQPAQTVAFHPAPTRKERVRAILPQNVRIVVADGSTDRRSGSGVCVASHQEDGTSYVLTNAHVAETDGFKSPRIRVLVDDHGEEHAYPAEVIALGAVPDMDLALLKVSGVTLSAAELAEDSEIELGDEVIVAAAPFGKSMSLSGGMVSHVDYDRALHVPESLKTDAPVGYGASGGGIYSLSSGKLLAIVEGYRTAKVGFAVADQPYSFDVPMPGETFAAPTAKMRRFLRGHGLAQLLNHSPEHPGPATATAQAQASLR